jgi:hypothetical protein
LWLVVATGLLLVGVLFFAAALSSSICFRLASLPCLQSRLGMPCTPFYSLDALVRQTKELRDVWHIVRG